MEKPRDCEICHKEVTKVGDHDPAYHVARAYHYPKAIVKNVVDSFHTIVCASDGQAWPCETNETYGGTNEENYRTRFPTAFTDAG